MTSSSHELTPAELGDLLAAERLGRPFLVYRDAERLLRLQPLGGDRQTVGRGTENDLSLPWDPEASRLHALLERLGGSWTVLDDQLSRNGTLVNGARVRGRRRLEDRDVIRFGSTEVTFRDPGQSADETKPASGAGEAAALTAAQRRVLVVLCRPLLDPIAPTPAPPSNPQIAAELTVSVEAVRTQMKTLFRLFEIPQLPQNRKRAELARRAIAAGVVTGRDAAG